MEVITSMVHATRSATKLSTWSVAFEVCGLLPLDASKVHEKPCVRDVGEDPDSTRSELDSRRGTRDRRC
jgi:hypothetical protein